MDEWVNGWPHVKSLKSNKSWPNEENSILDIFFDILLKPPQPLMGLFLCFRNLLVKPGQPLFFQNNLDDFWWCLFCVSKPEWAALLALGSGICVTHSLRFTSSVTPADLWAASMAAKPIFHIPASRHCWGLKPGPIELCRLGKTRPVLSSMVTSNCFVEFRILCNWSPAFHKFSKS